MFDFTPQEWRLFTRTEQSIIILRRAHGVETAERMRAALNWPLPGLMNKRTYEGHMVRLKSKMAKINAGRAEPARVDSGHGSRPTEQGLVAGAEGDGGSVRTPRGGGAT